MNQFEFSKIVHAKCILTGEHAVLRGHPGIVFPIKSKSLILSYYDDGKILSVDFDAQYGENLLMFFWKILNSCATILGKDFSDVTGRFLITNTIPMGFGMGFSSAICVAMSNWVLWKNWINESELFAFSQQLENIFHGKSSGIDIAGVIADSVIFYDRYNGFHEINMKWQPHLFLSSSDFSSSTLRCIQKVEQLWEKNDTVAELLDKKMAESSVVAEKSLSLTNELGIIYLAQAMNNACDCFLKWGLISDELKNHINKLQQAGAMAVKPTGSGAGGYVLSLWENEPKNLPFELIPLF